MCPSLRWNNCALITSSNLWHTYGSKWVQDKNSIHAYFTERHDTPHFPTSWTSPNQADPHTVFIILTRNMNMVFACVCVHAYIRSLTGTLLIHTIDTWYYVPQMAMWQITVTVPTTDTSISIQLGANVVITRTNTHTHMPHLQLHPPFHPCCPSVSPSCWRKRVLWWVPRTLRELHTRSCPSGHSKHHHTCCSADET